MQVHSYWVSYSVIIGEMKTGRILVRQLGDIVEVAKNVLIYPRKHSKSPPLTPIPSRLNQLHGLPLILPSFSPFSLPLSHNEALFSPYTSIFFPQQNNNNKQMYTVLCILLLVHIYSKTSEYGCSSKEHNSEHTLKSQTSTFLEYQYILNSEGRTISL